MTGKALATVDYVPGRGNVADWGDTYGNRVDRFLAGAISGILHGKSPSYLSTLMPNTFSMAPRYVREFVAKTGFIAPERDPFALIERKAVRLFRGGAPARRGVALLGDARDVGDRAGAALRERGLPDRARLVVTSPPYFAGKAYEEALRLDPTDAVAMQPSAPSSAARQPSRASRVGFRVREYSKPRWFPGPSWT